MHAAEQIKKFGLIGCLLLSACWFVYQSYNATVRFAFGDFQVAVVAAERINIGIDPYDLSALASRPIDPLYKYPPFLGSILRLVLPLGWHGICVLGLVLSFLFYITTFFLILNTARIKIRSGKSAILAIAFLVWQPTIDTLVGLQQEFLFLLLFTLACWGAVRVRPWHGLIGAAIAICTIIKVYPVLMLGYFIRKEWWTSLIAFAVSFAALTVISVLLSWPGLQREFWFDVLPHLSEGTAYVENQSLLAFFDRFFVNGNLVDPSLAQNIPAANAIFRVASAAVLLLSFGALIKTSQPPRVAFKVLLPAMLLIIQNAWVHYEMLLLLPFGLHLTDRSDKFPVPVVMLFGLATVLIAFGNENTVANTSSALLQSYKFFGVFLFWVLGIYAALAEGWRERIFAAI